MCTIHSNKVDIERKEKEITARCLTSAPCFGISALLSREKGEVVGSIATITFPILLGIPGKHR